MCAYLHVGMHRVCWHRAHRRNNPSASSAASALPLLRLVLLCHVIPRVKQRQYCHTALTRPNAITISPEGSQAPVRRPITVDHAAVGAADRDTARASHCNPHPLAWLVPWTGWN